MKLMLLVAGLVPGLAATADGVGRATDSMCSVNADHPIFDGVSWYGLYWEGAKVGHMNGSATIASNGRIVVDTVLEMTVGSSVTKMAERKEFLTASPHLLVNGLVSGSRGEIQYQQTAQGIKVSSTSGKHLIPTVQWTLCDEESVSMTNDLARFKQPGDQFTSTYLNIEELGIDRFEHVLEKLEVQRIGHQEHLFQTVLSKVESRGMTNRLRQRYRDGEAVTLQLGQFEARLEDKDRALGPIEPTDQIELLTVGSSGRLELDKLASIDELTLKVSIDDSLARIEEVVRDGPMQRVQYLDQNNAVVRIADFPNPARGVSAREDITPYLAANFSYPADHPRIVELAKSLRSELPADAPDQQIAEALLTYVAKKIRYELVGTKTVLAILDDPVGDCTEYAQLLVTLARASGLPAREVTGFIYYQHDPQDSTRGLFGGHAWTEIFIDGRWQPMDPTANEISPNKSHVQFKQFMVRGLQFEILDVQLD